jgi:hypothetical protein
MQAAKNQLECFKRYVEIQNELLAISRHASAYGGSLFHARNAYGSLSSPAAARCFMRLDHIASFIVNANHSVM